MSVTVNTEPPTRRLVAVGLGILGVLAAIGVAGSAAPQVAAAESDPSVIDISGHGWGHGRGMGQYGALGYVQDHGWTAAQVLDHYYGGTVAGPAPAAGRVDPARLRVDLRQVTGRPTTVALGAGRIQLVAADGRAAGSVSTTAQRAVRLTITGAVTAVATGPGCNGPWTAAGTIPAVSVVVRADTAAGGPNGLLQVCGPTGRTWYPGEILSTQSAGRQRTVNVVATEQYLRGVVPNEVPALWPAPVLEAQSVAARSYALAGPARSSTFSDTCDTTSCQLYRGLFTDIGGMQATTHPNTDAAIAATAGIVRLDPAGRVARTEFSSSSGGHTAGGTFPAVVDAGDAVASNRNHNWTTTVDLSAIERTYGLGRMRSIVVPLRNGLGADGGRVRTVEYRFERGAVTVSGAEARRQLGLRSDHFTPGQVRIGDEPVVDITSVLVVDLYRSALGREPDADGRRYWERTAAQGLKYERMATLFYGSAEYVRRSGGTNERFVDRLYRDVLGRPPDPDGRRYWLGQLDRGQATPADVANSFYRSVESRRDRVRALYRALELPPPSASTIDADAARLTRIDDFALAAELAAGS